MLCSAQSVDPYTQKFVSLHNLLLIYIVRNSKGFGRAQPIKVVGCRWNRHEEPVYVAVTYFRLTRILWENVTHRVREWEVVENREPLREIMKLFLEAHIILLPICVVACLHMNDL